MSAAKSVQGVSSEFRFSLRDHPVQENEVKVDTSKLTPEELSTGWDTAKVMEVLNLKSRQTMWWLTKHEYIELLHKGRRARGAGHRYDPVSVLRYREQRRKAMEQFIQQFGGRVSWKDK